MSPAYRARRGERGAALVIAILVLAILTVIGIALMLVTSTESRIAANEWSVNRAFYAADSGIRWASAEMRAPTIPLMKRPEFTTPFGRLTFQMPSHVHAAGSFFTGDASETGLQVHVQTPSLVGRRYMPLGPMNQNNKETALYLWSFEVRTEGGNTPGNPLVPESSKALVADIEVGPYPEKLPF
ncbi:MAG: pilus assembly PilX N-terminal domain-containing protein [Acidobacteriota bacterium]